MPILGCFVWQRQNKLDVQSNIMGNNKHVNFAVQVYNSHITFRKSFRLHSLDIFAFGKNSQEMLKNLILGKNWVQAKRN